MFQAELSMIAHNLRQARGVQNETRFDTHTMVPAKARDHLHSPHQSPGHLHLLLLHPLPHPSLRRKHRRTLVLRIVELPRRRGVHFGEFIRVLAFALVVLLNVVVSGLPVDAHGSNRSARADIGLCGDVDGRLGERPIALTECALQ